MLRAPRQPPVSSASGGHEAERRRLPGARAAGTDRSAAPPRPRLSLRRPPHALLASAAAFALLLLLGAVSFGPLVRGRIAREADRRNLDVEVESVRPGLFAISLEGVRVRPRGVVGVEARFDTLRVEVGAALSVKEVRAKGGGIFVEGAPDDVARQLRELRASTQKASSGADSASARTPMSAEDLSIVWKLPSEGEISGKGVRGARDGSAIKLGCASCSLRHKNMAVEATGVDVELAPDGGPRHVSASTVVITHASPPVATAPRVATAGVAEPVPPPLPVFHKRGAKTTARSDLPPSAPLMPDGPVLPFPDLHALRSRIATAVAAFAPRLPEGGTVDIAGLSVKLDVGDEPIAFGPGTFTLKRRSERLQLGFASGETREPGGTPLSIDADLPVSRGEISAHLAGGPVSLAALGVEDGMKGLTDVSRGTVSGKGRLVLSEAAEALTFDGEVTLRSISMKQPRIALEPLRGLDFSLSARGVLDDRGKLRVDDAQLDMGALHLRSHGTVEESPDHFGVSLAVDVAPAACQSLIDSSPQGLLPLVRSATMAGTFGASANLSFDTRTIDKLVLDYRIDDQCRMIEVPRDLSREHFEGAFTYRTYKPDGAIGETTTGPGTPSWTALDDISPFMVAAVLTTEDGAFYRHKGFNHAAIRSSVQANLKARRFVRGASTITMQLAKNLFLARDKALSRKIEEVILTDYLEQVFRKEDMMELYLNIVEFGPDVYGIAQAAEHYFGRKPEELHLAECFFLAALLPSPIRYGKLRDKGEVPETWMRHLRALMEIAAKTGKISAAELEEGLKESVLFYRPGDPRPEPRRPVTSRRHEEVDDDAAWQPLD